MGPNVTEIARAKGGGTPVDALAMHPFNSVDDTAKQGFSMEHREKPLSFKKKV